MTDHSPLNEHPVPRWARWRWVLPFHAVLFVGCAAVVFHSAGGEPFITPRSIDTFGLVAFPAVLVVVLLEASIALLCIAFRRGAGRVARLGLVICNIYAAQWMVRVPVYYTSDITKAHDRFLDIIDRCRHAQ